MRVFKSINLLSAMFLLFGLSNFSYGQSCSSIRPLNSPTVLMPGLTGFVETTAYSMTGNGTKVPLDLDADGKTDLLALTPTSLYLFMNFNGSTFAVQQIIPQGGKEVKAGDFNNDGKPDIVILANGSLKIIANQGNRSFAAPVSISVDSTTASVALDDLKRDGKLDMALLYRNAIRTCKGDGTVPTSLNCSQFGIPQFAGTMGCNPSRIETIKFASDRNPDVLAHCQIELWPEDGGAFFAFPNTSASNISSIRLGIPYIQFYNESTTGGAVGDFNQDGRVDYMVTLNDSNPMNLDFYRGTRTALTAPNPRIQYPTGLSADRSRLITSGDFNNDGKIDLVALGNEGLSYFGQGASSPILRSTMNGATQLMSPSVADFDTDGDQDLVLIEKGANSRLLLLKGNCFGGVQRSLSGNVVLEAANGTSHPVTFIFRDESGNSFTMYNVALTANGAFTINNLEPKRYTVLVKGDRWLRRGAVADLRNANVNNFTLLLEGGDGNNDNFVDVYDLDLLIKSFDRSEGEPEYIAGADYYVDGVVDVNDLDVFIRNFDKEGSN